MLTIYMEKSEIPVYKKIKWFTRRGKPQKIWAMIWGDASFLLLLVGSADLNMFCSSSFSCHIAFYSFVFMHKISTLVVCFTNGEHPRSTLHFLTRFQYKSYSLIWPFVIYWSFWLIFHNITLFVVGFNFCAFLWLIMASLKAKRKL